MRLRSSLILRFAERYLTALKFTDSRLIIERINLVANTPKEIKA
jgi:hypothetical protein